MELQLESIGSAECNTPTYMSIIFPHTIKPNQYFEMVSTIVIPLCLY